MEAGAILGNYRVLWRLGEGGMGQVFVGEHVVLGKRVAVKVLHPDLSRDEEMVARFFNEARASTVARHAGIVDVIDFGRDAGGRAFLVMELLEGESLAARIHAAPLPVEVAARICRQAASAVAAAHRAGIIHRDLKPGNLFLVTDPDAPLGVRVKVLDFGIAKLMGDLAGNQVKTHTGAMMGTPVYIAPEQIRGAEIDAQADVYALGCILFDALAGRPPFQGASVFDLLTGHVSQAPPRVRALRPDVPAALDDLVAAMLEKAPRARPAGMEAVVARLDAIYPPRFVPGATPLTRRAAPAGADAYGATTPSTPSPSGAGLTPLGRDADVYAATTPATPAPSWSSTPAPAPTPTRAGFPPPPVAAPPAFPPPAVAALPPLSAGASPSPAVHPLPVPRPARTPRRPGFSPRVILAIALGGAALVAASIYMYAIRPSVKAYTGYMKRARASEAQLALRVLARSAQAYFIENDDYPESAPLTPPDGCCQRKDGVCPVDPSTFGHATWRALDYAPTEPYRYQLQFEKLAQNRFRITARGDTDCDGTPAVFTLDGGADQSDLNVRSDQPDE